MRETEHDTPFENWTWHDLWNLLTINFKDKPFHNSVDWSRLLSSSVYPTIVRKLLDLQCSDYWKMHLWNYPYPFDMIWSLVSPCKTISLHEFAQKCVTPLRKAFLLRSSDPLKFLFSRVLTLNGPSNFVGPTLFLIEKGKLWSVIIWLFRSGVGYVFSWLRLLSNTLAAWTFGGGCTAIWPFSFYTWAQKFSF